MTKRSFIIASCVSAVIFGLVALVLLGRLYAVGALLIGGFGLPNWTLSHLQKKRMTRFQQGFPGAVEVIIRGVKSGLPLGVCLQTVAVQAQDPVRSEFQLIMGSTGVGFTIAQADERMAERVPLPETKFFAIVINIQQKAGGNLTEALGNLSQVLRDRQTLQLKVKALSSEAIASAWIMGLLPIIIGGLVYLTTPKYLEPLWTTQSGQLVLTGVAIWMLIGVMAMRMMLNFKP
jgi:tight adherence protein B